MSFSRWRVTASLCIAGLACFGIAQRGLPVQKNKQSGGIQTQAGGTPGYIDANDIALWRTRLANVSTSRPRIMMEPNDFIRINSILDSDPVAYGYWVKVLIQAGGMISQPLPVYDVSGGKVLLQTARTSLERISTLAFVYRMNRGPTFLERARQEMLTIASWPDWNPVHMFDVAELTNAMSIGYDMLYPYLSANDRATIKNAIITKGLNATIPKYQVGTEWWLWSGYNMTIVVNSAMIIGGLAVADTDPDVAATAISAAFKSIAPGLNTYGNDGGWIEGPDYWEYATSYLSYMLNTLQNSMGMDNGVLSRPGVQNAGDFRIYTAGIGDEGFNFGCTPEGNFATPCLMFLSQATGKRAYAYVQKEMIKRRNPKVWDLIWYVPGTTEADLTSLPPSKTFPDVGVAVLQSSWTDPNRQKLCMKGGDNTNHDSQLEVGTFTYDSMGERFVMDLGWDWAPLPWNYARYGQYYRNNTTGNNTILFDDRNQDWWAPPATISSSDLGPARPWVQINANGVNSYTVMKWYRGAALIGDRYALVQDEYQAVPNISVEWVFHTRAQASVNGREATLTRNGKVVKAYIVQPTNARWATLDCQPPAPQSSNTGVTKLGFRTYASTGVNRIVVAFVPQKAGAIDPSTLPTLPFSDWNRINTLP